MQIKNIFFLFSSQELNKSGTAITKNKIGVQNVVKNIHYYTAHTQNSLFGRQRAHL